MSFAVVIRRQARAEFDEAFDWYERQRPGLGVEFAARVQAVLDRVSEMPELHGCVFQDVRTTLVRPFPFSIYYRIRGNRVVVVAIFHNKRNPEIWKSRV